MMGISHGISMHQVAAGQYSIVNAWSAILAQEFICALPSRSSVVNLVAAYYCKVQFHHNNCPLGPIGIASSRVGSGICVRPLPGVHPLVWTLPLEILTSSLQVRLGYIRKPYLILGAAALYRGSIPW